MPLPEEEALETTGAGVETAGTGVEAEDLPFE
jgi:hypothetical protein